LGSRAFLFGLAARWWLRRKRGKNEDAAICLAITRRCFFFAADIAFEGVLDVPVFRSDDDQKFFRSHVRGITLAVTADIGIEAGAWRYTAPANA